MGTFSPYSARRSGPRFEKATNSFHYTSPLHLHRSHLRKRIPASWVDDRFSDSNLPSEISSRKVETKPLVKRAYRSSFVPVNVRVVFRMLKRTLGSGPPMWPKWCLFIKVFKEYRTVNKKNKRQNFLNLTKCESTNADLNHMTSTSKWWNADLKRSPCLSSKRKKT